MKRRDILRGALLAGAGLALLPGSLRASPRQAGSDGAALEKRHGGKLGLCILDTADGRTFQWRADERFLLCSTFKLLVVAQVLARVDAGKERLERRITFTRDDVLEWAPVTRRHVGAPGMSVEALCEAAMTISDNTAANLLLEAVGGPAAVTAWLRHTGDPTTRLDRHEPELNRPDGERDTTTPMAMLRDMQRLLLGDVLKPDSRARLVDWMRHNRTAAGNLVAGLPDDWTLGDKTGSGNTANNDVAILWPPAGKPLLVAAYYSNPDLDTDARKAVLADAGRLVARWHAAR